jgi:PAS domain S-box-containing protein
MCGKGGQVNASGGTRNPGPESEERIAARRRGRARRADHREHFADSAAANASENMFCALAENVRDYAIFLLDVDGIITYWGEGAHAMKRWTAAETEGSHLRMLYPDGGSEDGTAEAHLRQAAETGEYVGEGRRIRQDGSSFWAHVTLTALKARGELIGFAKVTRNMTELIARDAAVTEAIRTIGIRDTAVAIAALAEADRDAAVGDLTLAREVLQSTVRYSHDVLLTEIAELEAECEALRSELVVLNAELQAAPESLEQKPRLME